jgi:surface protein
MMDKVIARSFEDLIDKAINYAVKGNLSTDEICNILKRKTKEVLCSSILFSGIHGTCSWEINKEGVLRIYPQDGKFGKFGNYDPATFCTAPWKKYSDYVVKIVVEQGVSTYEDASLLFFKMSKCVEMDLRGLNTSSAIDMEKMFFGCSSLVKLELGSFDVSNVQNASCMFYGCDKLKGKEEIEARLFKPKKSWQPTKKKTSGDSIKEKDIKPR